MGTAEGDLIKPSALEECGCGPMFLGESKGLSKHSNLTFSFSTHRSFILSKNGFDFGGLHFEFVLGSLAAWQTVFMSFRATRNWRKAEKLATPGLQLTLHPSPGQLNVIFRAIIHFIIFTAVIFEVCSMFGSKEYGSREAITQTGS